MPMKDQRTMTGPTHLSTVKQIRAKWADTLPLVETGRRVYAYVNAGRWVADCPVDNGGIACWDGNPDGACLDCGSGFMVGFPGNVDEIVDVVEGRPEANRNWTPGETVAMLAAENLVH